MDSRHSVSVDYAAFVDRELVVEAVPEDWAMKLAALRRVEEQLSPGTVLASNTSSLSVSGLAESWARPQDFIGLHFFNPVPASTLVEVVMGKLTRHEPHGTSPGLGPGTGQERRRGQ